MLPSAVRDGVSTAGEPHTWHRLTWMLQMHPHPTKDPVPQFEKFPGQHGRAPSNYGVSIIFMGGLISYDLPAPKTEEQRKND